MVDDVVRLASLSADFQPALGLFTAEREATEVKMSTSTSEAMVGTWKKGGFPCPG